VRLLCLLLFEQVQDRPAAGKATCPVWVWPFCAPPDLRAEALVSSPMSLPFGPRPTARSFVARLVLGLRALPPSSQACARFFVCLFARATLAGGFRSQSFLSWLRLTASCRLSLRVGRDATWP
jgi:hypothetical protein